MWWVLGGYLVFGPQALENIEVLVHDLAPLMKVDANGIEFALVPARGEAQQQPPARDYVHAGELLGKDHRIPEWQNKNTSTEFDCARSCRDRGQERERVDDREVGLDPKQDVVPDPGRFEAELLDPLALFD